jgi:Kelch motif
MYLFGGSKGNCDANDKMYTLDLKLNRWDIVSDQQGDIPKTRDEHSASLYESNSMVIFGGFVNGVRNNDVYKFTFITRKWELLKPSTAAAPAPRAAHSSIIYKDLIIIFGGKDEDNEKLNDVWAFNLRNFVWECYHANT